MPPGPERRGRDGPRPSPYSLGNDRRGPQPGPGKPLMDPATAQAVQAAAMAAAQAAAAAVLQQAGMGMGMGIPMPGPGAPGMMPPQPGMLPPMGGRRGHPPPLPMADPDGPMFIKCSATSNPKAVAGGLQITLISPYRICFSWGSAATVFVRLTKELLTWLHGLWGVLLHTQWYDEDCILRLSLWHPANFGRTFCCGLQS